MIMNLNKIIMTFSFDDSFELLHPLSHSQSVLEWDLLPTFKNTRMAL